MTDELRPSPHNGSASPDERREEFLREHEERMKKVDEALEEAKHGQRQEREAVVEKRR